MVEDERARSALKQFQEISGEVREIQSNPDKHPYNWEMDVDYLIGAKGEKLQPVKTPDPENADTELADWIDGGNGDMAERSVEFVSGEWGKRELAYLTQNMIGKVASRLAQRWTGIPIRDAVRSLREPIRSVAVACVFEDQDPVEVAHEFGTSVETIEFLKEVALDSLANLITLTRIGLIDKESAPQPFESHLPNDWIVT